MNILNKLKNLFKNKKNAISPPSTDNQAPVTTRIMAWLDSQGWQYEHRKPNIKNGRTHHLILNLTDQSLDWTCVFRINENNQLIAIFGILPNTVPPSHFAPMMMKIAYANTSISFGSIELDPTDGEVRVRMSVDGEFGILSDKAISCYLQGVASLTEMAQHLYDEVMKETEPSPFWHDYVSDAPESEESPRDDGGFFIPTHERQ